MILSETSGVTAPGTAPKGADLFILSENAAAWRHPVLFAFVGDFHFG